MRGQKKEKQQTTTRRESVFSENPFQSLNRYPNERIFHYLPIQSLGKLLKTSNALKDKINAYISRIAEIYDFNLNYLFEQIKTHPDKNLTLNELAQHLLAKYQENNQSFKEENDLPLITNNGRHLNQNSMQYFFLILWQRVTHSNDKDARERFRRELPALSKLIKENNRDAFVATYNNVTIEFNKTIRFPKNINIAKFDIYQLLENAQNHIETILKNGNDAITAVFGAEFLSEARDKFRLVQAQLKKWQDNPGLVNLSTNQNRIFANPETQIVTLGLQFFVKSNNLERELTLIHEASHAATGVKSLDILYKNRFLFTLLQGKGALKNADSYRMAVEKIIPNNTKQTEVQNKLSEDEIYLRKVVGYADWLLQKTADMLSYLENGYRGRHANVSKQAADLIRNNFPLPPESINKVFPHQLTKFGSGIYFTDEAQSNRGHHSVYAALARALRFIINDIQEIIVNNYRDGKLSIGYDSFWLASKQKIVLESVDDFYTFNVSKDASRLIMKLYIHKNKHISDYNDFLEQLINAIVADFFSQPEYLNIDENELLFINSL